MPGCASAWWSGKAGEMAARAAMQLALTMFHVKHIAGGLKKHAGACGNTRAQKISPL